MTDSHMVNPSDEHQIYVEPDGMIVEVYGVDSVDAQDYVRVDHIVTGAIVGYLAVEGDAVLVLEFTLAGEEETAVVAMEPRIAKVVMQGIDRALQQSGNS